MCLCLHVKCLLSLSDINQNLDVSTDFSKNVPNVKFYENPCRESQRRGWGQTGRHDELKSVYSFCYAPKHQDCTLLVE